MKVGLVTYGKLMDIKWGEEVYNGKGYLIKLKGFRRVLNVRSTNDSAKGVLGVEKDKNSQMEAVLYISEEEKIIESDKYEWKYDRVKISNKLILIGEKIMLPEVVYIYIPKAEWVADNLVPEENYVKEVKDICKKYNLKFILKE